MLGFSPLASAPLGDDGVVGEVVHLLTASPITTGQPVVGASTVSQDQDLSADGLTTGTPVIASSTLVENHDLAPTAITTGQPVVGSPTVTLTTAISADDITSGQPIVGSADVSQDHDLSLVGITTAAPSVPSITMAEEAVRNKRDRLLSDTDWMALSDNTMTPEWATYRQALRDITAQEGFPYSGNWPTKP